MNWNPHNLIRHLRFLGPAAMTAVVALGFLLAFKYLLPFVLALLVAAMVWPLVRLLERIRIGRVFGSVLCLSLFFVIAAVVVVALLVQTSQELLGLAAAIPGLIQQADLWFTDALTRFEQVSHLVPDNLAPYADQAMGELATQGIAFAKETAKFLISGVGKMPGFFLVLIFAILASYIITLDLSTAKDRLFGSLDPELRQRILAVGHEMVTAMGKYLKALVILVGITFVVALVGLSLIGVEYAVVGSMIIAVSDLLPVLGPGTIFIPWSLWMLISGETTKGLLMLGLYGFIFVFRQAVQPKILADTMELPALPLLIAIWIGLTQFGLAGLLLAPFVLVLYQAIDKAMRRPVEVAPEETHE